MFLDKILYDDLSSSILVESVKNLNLVENPGSSNEVVRIHVDSATVSLFLVKAGMQAGFCKESSDRTQCSVRHAMHERIVLKLSHHVTA